MTTPTGFDIGHRTQAWRDDITRIIREYGVVVCTIARENGTNFAYTIGRTERHRPELVASGPLSFSSLHALLMRGVAADDRQRLLPGEVRRDVLDGTHGVDALPVPVLIRTVDPDDAEMYQATDYYEGTGRYVTSFYLDICTVDRLERKPSV